MKKAIFVFVVIFVGFMPCFAQETIKLEDFLNNFDWTETRSSVENRYKNNMRTIPESVCKISGESNLKEVIGCVKLGKYDCFPCMIADSLSDRILSMFVFINPDDIKDVDRTEFVNEIDGILLKGFGEPIISDKGERKEDKTWGCCWHLADCIVSYTSQKNDEYNNLFVLIAINIDDGSNDFRVARWGDSMASVMNKEGRRNEWDGYSINPNVYSFSSSIAGNLCDVLYIFSKNRLVRTKYYFTNVRTDGCIRDYENFKRLLTEKYGEPLASKEEWADPSYENRVKDGHEILMGRLKYYSYWYASRTSIVLILRGGDGGFNFAIEYSSRKYQKEEDKEVIKDL